MKNTIKILGIIALMAVIGFSMSACKEEDTSLPTTDNVTEQTIIKVTGLTTGTTSYNSKHAFMGLSMDGYSDVGLTLPKQITDDTMEFKIMNENLKMVSVSGLCTLLLFITETSDPNSTSAYEGYAIEPVSKGTTTLKLSDFTKRN
jgi:hypothetical protein